MFSFQENTWHHVVFRPFSHEAWKTAADNIDMSRTMVKAIIDHGPVLVYVPSQTEFVCDSGWGVGFDDSVIEVSKPADSIELSSKSGYSLRAAKDKDGNLYIVRDHNGMNLILKRYEADDVAVLKAFL